MIIPLMKKCSEKTGTYFPNKGLYITNINIMPDNVVDGIYDALKAARPDHVLGMYCYFFSPISRKELRKRYVIKGKEFGEPKQATIFYVQKHIIDPMHLSIKKACIGMDLMSIITDSSECRIAQRTSSQRED